MMKTKLLLLAFLLSIVYTTKAQETTATLNGRVSDETKNAIVGATISVKRFVPDKMTTSFSSLPVFANAMLKSGLEPNTRFTSLKTSSFIPMYETFIV